MKALFEALAAMNFATLQRLDHPEDSEVALAALAAWWRWEEAKRNLEATHG